MSEMDDLLQIANAQQQAYAEQAHVQQQAQVQGPAAQHNGVPPAHAMPANNAGAGAHFMHGPQAAVPLMGVHPDIANAIVALGQHQDQFFQTQVQNTQLLQALANRVLTAAAAPPRHHTARFHEPRVFDGKAREVVSFLREIRAALHLQRDALTTDYDKAVWLALYLKDGTPTEWFRSVELARPALLQNFDGLVEDFKKHFEDPDLVATSYRKLEELKQTGAAAQYAARFDDIVSYLDITDETKRTFFKRGLKSTLKDVLVGVARPDDFRAYVQQVIEVDNRLHDRELEAKRESGKPKQSSSSPSTSRSAAPATSARDLYHPPHVNTSAPSSSSNNGAVPMEVDAVRRGPLTQAERERRAKDGLCFYCGKGRHHIADCPNMSPTAKKARHAKLPSSGKA